jgi:hypothetical protein
MKAFAGIAVLLLLAVTALAADATGKWSGNLIDPNGDGGGVYMVLKQTGGAVTGTAGPDENQQWTIENGKAEGNKVSFEVKSPDHGVFKCDLTLDGDSLKGDVNGTSPDGHAMKVKVDLSRVK